MKQYLISFDVVSRSSSLSELSTQLAPVPSASSHTKDDPRVRRRVWEDTVWRHVIMDGSEDQLHSAWCKAIQFLENNSAALSKLRAQEPGIVLVLSIGVIADTATTSARLPSEVLAALGNAGGSLEVVTYPADGAAATGQ
jgi:hypothetical protein